MPKAQRVTCEHCESKMSAGASFCPSCAHPTPWCSYDERVQWEVLQYKRMREKSSEPKISSPAPSLVAEAPERTYRRATVVKQPVTVKIERRFGRQGAAAAAAVAEQLEAPAARPDLRIAEAPAQEAAVAEKPASAPVEQDAETPVRRRPARTTAPESEPAPRARRSTQPAPKPAAPKPAASKPERPKLERTPKPAAAKTERSAPARPKRAPAAKSVALPEDLDVKLASIEHLTRRVATLEARITQLTAELQKKREPLWRRLLRD